MSNSLHQYPTYPQFCEQLSILALPISASMLHGILCGYLCAGALHEAETYLRALTSAHRGEPARVATQALFGLYSVSQQQIDEDNFSFQLLLPEDDEPLDVRAKAFGEWCEGFTKTLTGLGIAHEQLEEEECQESLVHLLEFSELDYTALQVQEEDERALMEVSEYARMAVLRLYWDLKVNQQAGGNATSGRVKH